MTTPAPLPPRVAHNKDMFDAWMKAHGIDPRFSMLQEEFIPSPDPWPTKPLDLSNVTLWASVEHGNNLDYLARVIRVLRYMNRFCRFKQTRLMTHLNPGPDFEFEWVKTEQVPADQLRVAMPAPLMP